MSVPSMKEYILTEKLGCGTFATVYKAYKKSRLKEIVAIKCIEKKRLNKHSMENLLTEISVMKDLSHRHIVKLIDFEWDEQYIFLVMEYCSGGDLSHFIKNKIVLEENSARKFLRQLGNPIMIRNHPPQLENDNLYVALALQFLRDKGIAHMDLKPQNLLLTGETPVPVLKVGDFGMAQHLGIGDLSVSFRGSPLYMAPEIMLGECYDAKVDLWSVGVILYETLFGEAPFASKTFSELESKIRDPNPVVIPSSTVISDNCRHLLTSLLQRDPTTRLSFDDFFKHPFIDLDHAPTSKCLPQARALVMKAVTNDSEGKLSQAISFYIQALEYFIPALEFEEDQAIRDVLKQKIEQYIQRTEYLKQILQSKKSLCHAAEPSVQLLEKWQADFPKIKIAALKVDNAERQNKCGNHELSLELYKEAVAILMPIVEAVPTREEKQFLKSEIKAYLDRAEEIALLSQKPTPRLPDQFYGTMSSTLNSKCRIQ